MENHRLQNVTVETVIIGIRIHRRPLRDDAGNSAILQQTIGFAGMQSREIWKGNDILSRLHTYLMGIEHYFSGEEYFKIDAYTKADALVKSKSLIERDPRYSIGGNYKFNSLRVVKKLQRRNPYESQ